MSRRRILAIAGLGGTLGVALIIVVVVLVVAGGPAGGPAASPTPIASEYYQVGEWAVTSELMVSVDSAQRIYTYGQYSWARHTAPAGTVYIRIVATVTNIGDTPLYTSSADFTIRDSKGRRYTSIAKPPHIYNPFPASTIPAGHTASGVVLFVVPEIASGLEVTYLMDGAPPVLAIWEL